VSVAAVAIGVVVAAAPYLSPHDAPVSSYPAKATATIAAHVAIGMAFMLVGLLAWWRLPNNRTGPLMTLAGAVFYTSDLGWLRTPWTYVIADEWRGLFYAVLFHLLLAFPSGRLRSTVDRVFVASFYAWVSLARPFPSAAFYDPHLDGLDLPRNPLLVRGDLDLNLAVDRWLSRIDLAFTAVLVVLLIVHWYRSGRPGRRALTPAFAIAVAVLVPLTVGAVVELPSQEVLTWGVQLLLLLLPFGFLAGLVRTKLARSAAPHSSQRRACARRPVIARGLLDRRFRLVRGCRRREVADSERELRSRCHSDPERRPPRGRAGSRRGAARGAGARRRGGSGRTPRARQSAPTD
jgi:hypothetical protein